MKFELILAVDSGDGQITNVPLARMTRPDVALLHKEDFEQSAPMLATF